MRKRWLWLLIPAVLFAIACDAGNPHSAPTANPAIPNNPNNADGEKLQRAIAACGEGCHILTLQVRVTDADGLIVESDDREGIDGDVTINSWQIDPNTKQVVPGPIYDLDNEVLAQSPWERPEKRLPFDEMHFLPAPVVSSTFDIEVQLPTGWTLTCDILDENAFGTNVSHDEEHIPIPLDEQAGMPEYRTVHCSWPGFTGPHA